MRERSLKLLGTRAIIIFAALLLALAPAGRAFADGGQTLDPPSIPIASGTGTAAEGIGLVQGQPGTINFSVPAGVTVKQVLLYWNVFRKTAAINAGHDAATLNGVPITGTLIGGPDFFFDGGVSSAYRIDITDRGLVAPGANSLSVGGIPSDVNVNGAGVLVIYSDGLPMAKIDVRDGDDTAFIDFPGTRGNTVPQTFTFAPAISPRTADLRMFFASVQGSASGGGFRPTVIEIHFDVGAPIFLDNLLDSNDGDEWDTVNLSISIPANASQMTVQAFSRDDNNTGQLPASFVWIGAAFNVPCTGRIGDFVWSDTDGDGFQDPGEQGIPGVTLNLGGGFNATTVTNANGFYEFAGLCAGTYTVTVVANTLPPGSVPTLCHNDPSMVPPFDTDSNCSPQANIVLTQDNSENPTIDFGYVTPSGGCLLMVEKFCSVPPPPTTGYVCKTPFSEFTMIWQGAEAVYLVREDGQRFPSSGFINPGSSFTFTGFGSLGNDVDFTVFDDGDLQIGKSTFHVSCSDADMNGPEDCGKDEGNGKNRSGFTVNSWKLDGFVTAGGPVSCSVSPADLATECEVFAAKPGSCADGKPTALVFEYNPSGICDGADNKQSGKFICGAISGSTPLGALQNVVMTGSDAPKFDVAISGNTVKISKKDGTSFPANIFYNIIGSNGTQSYALHTSCSQRLEVGDKFGPLTLAGFTPLGSSAGQPNVIYTYKISHTGASSVSVDVNDNLLGTIATGLSIPAGDTVTLTKEATLPGPSQTVTNTVTVTDSASPDVCVAATDTATVTVNEPPEACTSATKVKQMTLEYTGGSCGGNNPQGGKFLCSGSPGAEPVSIVITRDASKVTATPNNGIVSGTQVTFTNSDGKLAADTAFKVGGQSLSIHTSCSQVLAEGDQFGSMKVIDLVLIPK